jgi:hypothetical protein
MAADPKKIQEQLKQIQSLYDRLGKINPYAGMDAGEISKSVNEVKKLENALMGVQSQVENMSQSFSDLSAQLEATINEISKGPTATQKFAKGFKGVLAEVKKLKYEEEGLDSLNLRQLQNLKKRALKRTADAKEAAIQLLQESGLQGMINEKIDKRTKAYKDLTDAQKSALGFLQKEDKTVESINNKINNRIQKEKELLERMGGTGAALKGIEGLLQKIGLGDLSNAMGFDQINADLREFAETGASSQEIFQKGIELSGEAIETALKDPLVQVAIAAKAFATGFKMSIGAVIKGIKQLEEDTGKLAKNLNVGAQEARQMSEDFAAAAIGSDRLFVSSEGLAQSTVDINDALGTTVRFNAENLATFTKLRETAGLTSEEMMGIQKLSLATGQSFDDIADSTLKQVAALNESTGIQINSKKVMAEIANTSEATQLSLGKSGPALAAAITTAKGLGMELSKVEDIAGSILNFEQSIQDELAAELLLGKNINLEKARQAALNNDLETVATEIAKQAGSAAEFAEMNRIQQDALAKAVGMSRDELGKTLFIQEQLKGASGIDKENRAKMLESLTDQYGLEKAQQMLKEKGLKNLLNQASETEKIQASFDKINEFVKKIGAAFAPVVEMMGSVASALAQSEVAMAALVGILGAVGVALTVVAGKALLNFAISVGQMFAKVVGGMSALGPPGVIAGLALGGVAVAGAIGAYQSLKADDMAMAPSSPGYGDRILSTPKGSISLNNEDTVVAGTNLGGGNGKAMAAMANSLKTIAQSSAETAKGLKRQKPVPLYQITRG